MARTAAQLEMEIARLMDVRFTAKSQETKRLAHERIEYLRGELMLQKQVEATPRRLCAYCDGSYAHRMLAHNGRE